MKPQTRHLRLFYFGILLAQKEQGWIDIMQGGERIAAGQSHGL